jgi:hypothetical protein
MLSCTDANSVITHKINGVVGHGQKSVFEEQTES